MAAARLTTDHDTIREWAKQRGGKPAQVDDGREGAGILRIEFPGHGDSTGLKRMQWPSFFKKFDVEELAFLYQETSDRGELSRFCKFVNAPQGLLRTLHAEHEQIRGLLEKMQQTTPRAAKTRPQLLEQLREVLIPHMAGEEKAFYKKLKKGTEDDDQLGTVFEGYEEHRHAKDALARLEKADIDTPQWAARLSVLKELVEHHIEEEEEEMFGLARNVLGQQGLEEVQAHFEKREKKALKKME